MDISFFHYDFIQYNWTTRYHKDGTSASSYHSYTAWDVDRFWNFWNFFEKYICWLLKGDFAKSYYRKAFSIGRSFEGVFQFKSSFFHSTKTTNLQRTTTIQTHFSCTNFFTKICFGTTFSRSCPNGSRYHEIAKLEKT